MDSRFDQHLRSALDAIAGQNLLRRVRKIDSPQGAVVQLGGRELINFSSNDYLGLANHPTLKEATAAAIHQYGAGAGASRLICGSLKPFHELEDRLADFKRTEACLTFSTGYAAAVGTITSLMGKGDIVIIDKLIHACIVDAARMSGATLRVFKHNDLNDLERILRWADAQTTSNAPRRNTLVITESVFSMDGDTAPLNDIARLKEQYGAWLMVDEAHATGLFGERRSGLVEQTGLTGEVEIQMGTLGKAVGSAGGFICGSRQLIDLLINSARSFIFSTAPVPAAAAAAIAGIELMQGEDGRQRCEKVWRNTNCAAVKLSGNPKPGSTIVPVHIGDEAEAVRVSEALQKRGYLVPAIRYPTVARGAARLRVTLSADHESNQINALATTLQEIIHQQS